jgi:ribosomal protein S18 acetylase RimI-like enzyme
MEAVVDLAVRAWEPVFASMRQVLGEDVFSRLYPDWRASQAEEVRASCKRDEWTVFVAVANDRPVGFVAVELDAFWERMGGIPIIGVDPDFQRRGVAEKLTKFALDFMRERGMDAAVVETGADTGHAAARGLYEAAGFTLLPVARYFRLLV